MNREEIVTWLIERSHPNPRHAKYVNRGLFENDHRVMIETMMDFQEKLTGSKEN